MNSSSTEKLQKVIARAGLCSRREAERWIQAGRLKINGQLATLGDRVAPEDTIQLDNRKLKPVLVEKPRVLLYHKKVGEICSRNDPEKRQSVFDRLPKLAQGRWIAVGRLDFNTSGLLLFTDNGDLANKLMHPSSGIDREYMVRVMGSLSAQTINILKEGVLLDDGIAKFTDVVPAKQDTESINQWYYVCLMEGRNREVRRLFESQSLMVNRLKRVRFGPLFIPAKLRQGQYQELSDKELSDLMATIQ